MLIRTDSPISHNLRRILWLRITLLAGLVIFVAVVDFGLGLLIPIAPVCSILFALAVLSAFTWARLQYLRWPTSDVELAIHLCCDIAALTGVLYFTGGWTNPLVSLFLVPIAVAAATLPAVFTWIVTGTTVSAYAFLTTHHVPLPDYHGRVMSGFSLHIMGMWVTFVLSAVLIAFFVVRMAGSLRERARKLADAREANLRNEQIIGLATLAAGAAHQLSTPLSTIAIIADELKRDTTDSEHRSELALLLRQVEVCKRILSQLASTAGQLRAEGGSRRLLDVAMAEILEKWKLIRPAAKINVSVDSAHPPPYVVLDSSFAQALMNLLDNAADVSPGAIDVKVSWDSAFAIVDIMDRGPGLTDELQKHLGQPFFTTKGDHGMGVGIFLANTTVERLGGQVAFRNREGGGAWVQVTLPLSCISAERSI